MVYVSKWKTHAHTAFIFGYALNSTIAGPLSNFHAANSLPADNPSYYSLTSIFYLGCLGPVGQPSGWHSPGSFTCWLCLPVLHSSQAWCLSSPSHSPSSLLPTALQQTFVSKICCLPVPFLLTPLLRPLPIPTIPNCPLPRSSAVSFVVSSWKDFPQCSL